MALIWVTGCFGFIAREVIAQLAARGDQVGGIGHPSGTSSLSSASRVEGDIDARNLNLLLEKTGLPDTIIHLAGGSSVGKSFENPADDRERSVGSTEALLTWAADRAATPRFVIVSSAAVYGDRYPGPIPEHADTVPMSPYGSHKLAMERLTIETARRRQIPAIIVRLFSVYGRGLRKQFFFDLCGRLQAPPTQLRLLGTGEELRDYLEVSDAAALLLLAANYASPSVPIVNGGTGIATRIAEAASLTLAAWRSRGGPPLSLAFGGAGRPGDPAALVADVTRIREWKFRPRVTLDRGIAAYVDWYRREIGGET